MAVQEGGDFLLKAEIRKKSFTKKKVSKQCQNNSCFAIVLLFCCQKMILPAARFPSELLGDLLNSGLQDVAFAPDFILVHRHCGLFSFNQKYPMC